jgi:hypothetical protein
LKVKAVGGARTDDCFVNIERHLATNGGSMCVGWQIWEWPRVLVEAEFHAVWKDKTGTLIDITPKQDREERILFLPDPDRHYKGKRVNNVRRALSTEPTVIEFVAACDRESEIMNGGSRAHKHGLIALTAKETQELAKAGERKILAYLKMIEKFDGSNPR